MPATDWYLFTVPFPGPPPRAARAAAVLVPLVVVILAGLVGCGAGASSGASAAMSDRSPGADPSGADRSWADRSRADRSGAALGSATPGQASAGSTSSGGVSAGSVSAGTVVGRYRATRVADDPALPPGQAAWQLPGSVHARAGYGVRAGGGYAVFGIGPGDPRGGDAEIGPAEQARFGVLDLRTGELTAYQGVGTGRTADAAAPVTDASGHVWLVRTEAGPRPAQECPATPDYCWTWSLYATSLPSGDSVQIAAASRPGPQFFLPQVVTDGRTAAWLDASAGAVPAASPAAPAAGGGDVMVAVEAGLMAWQPGTPARVVATHLPEGRLSLDAGAAWIGTADQDGHRLLRVALSTGAVSPTALPAGAADAVVAGGNVVYVHRPPDDAPPDTPTTVDVAPVAAPGSARSVYSGSDVYTVNWGTAGRVVLSSAGGYLITDGRTNRSLRLDLLSGVHNDAGRLALVQRRGDAQVVVVAG